MSKPMPLGHTREWYENSHFIYMICYNKAASFSKGKTRYDIIESPKFKSKNSTKLIGCELPYFQCLEIMRKRKAIKQKVIHNA